MASILSKTDFTGKYKINQNCYSQLQEYIDKYEKRYLQELLGCELYELFEDDLIAGSGVPTEARFTDIFEPFCKDDQNCIRQSEGIKEMLKGFIYFEFVRDTNSKATQNGTKKNKVETSESTGFNQHDIFTRFNLSTETFQSIQWFICEDSSVYPEYNGQHQEFCHWSF